VDERHKQHLADRARDLARHGRHERRLGAQRETKRARDGAFIVTFHGYDYGANRAHGCELAPGTRYDLVAAGLGCHGEVVERAADLAPSLARAFAAGRPAVVNVMLDGQPAPTLKR
jgi:hypothetical protein